MYVSFIACCKCPGTCSTNHCPCQKGNSSCGADCGCSSDKCKNREKRPNILNFFTPPSSKISWPNAPSIPAATPQIIIMQTVLTLISMVVDLIERIPPLTKSPRTHQSYVHFTTNTNVVPMMEISTIAANAQHMYIVLAMKNIEQLWQ